VVVASDSPELMPDLMFLHHDKLFFTARGPIPVSAVQSQNYNSNAQPGMYMFDITNCSNLSNKKYIPTSLYDTVTPSDPHGGNVFNGKFWIGDQAGSGYNLKCDSDARDDVYFSKSSLPPSATIIEEDSLAQKVRNFPNGAVSKECYISSKMTSSSINHHTFSQLIQKPSVGNILTRGRASKNEPLPRRVKVVTAKVTGVVKEMKLDAYSSSALLYSQVRPVSDGIVTWNVSEHLGYPNAINFIKMTLESIHSNSTTWEVGLEWVNYDFDPYVDTRLNTNVTTYNDAHFFAFADAKTGPATGTFVYNSRENVKSLFFTEDSPWFWPWEDVVNGRSDNGGNYPAISCDVRGTFLRETSISSGIQERYVISDQGIEGTPEVFEMLKNKPWVRVTFNKEIDLSIVEITPRQMAFFDSTTKGLTVHCEDENQVSRHSITLETKLSDGTALYTDLSRDFKAAANPLLYQLNRSCYGLKFVFESIHQFLPPANTSDWGGSDSQIAAYVKKTGTNTWNLGILFFKMFNASSSNQITDFEGFSYNNPFAISGAHTLKASLEHGIQSYAVPTPNTTTPSVLWKHLLLGLGCIRQRNVRPWWNQLLLKATFPTPQGTPTACAPTSSELDPDALLAFNVSSGIRKQFNYLGLYDFTGNVGGIEEAEDTMS
jgi:hypothetical protein